MNDLLWKDYIHLKKAVPRAREGFIQRAGFLWIYVDRLALLETPEAKQVLVDVYQELGLYASAFSLFLELVDKSDRKQVKKLLPRVQSWRRFALLVLWTEKEKRLIKRKSVPCQPSAIIRIHWGLVLLRKGSLRPVLCVGKTTIYYVLSEAAHENEPRLAVPSCHGSMT